VQDSVTSTTRIIDFEDGRDEIDLSAFSGLPAADLQGVIDAAAGRVRVSPAGKHVFRLDLTDHGGGKLIVNSTSDDLGVDDFTGLS